MSALRSQAKERHYRAYVTDALKVIADNTAKAAVPGYGVIGVGSVLNSRWVDLTAAQDQKEDVPKTGDEIAADIMQRAGLHQKGGD